MDVVVTHTTHFNCCHYLHARVTKIHISSSLSRLMLSASPERYPPPLFSSIQLSQTHWGTADLHIGWLLNQPYTSLCVFTDSCVCSYFTTWIFCLKTFCLSLFADIKIARLGRSPPSPSYVIPPLKGYSLYNHHEKYHVLCTGVYSSM